jgi:hypothetical protein
VCQVNEECRVDEAKTLNNIVRLRQNNQACRMQPVELIVGKGCEHMVVELIMSDY